MRMLAAVIMGTLLVAVGAESAHAQDVPGYRPAAVGLPQQWTTPRDVNTTLVRSRTPRVTGRYHIRRDAWAPKGPVEVRDEWLLAQPKLTLPAVSPDPIPQGDWIVKFHIDRGNDFGWDQSSAGNNPLDRRFLIDGEHQTTELNLRYGLYPRLALGIRVPIHWRGVGFMDGAIDWFHELTEPIGFLDNGRPFFSNERFRVEGRTPDGTPISWNDERGAGLGNIELEAYWNVLMPCCRSDWRATAIARLGLPTGTEPFDTGGVDIGLQFVVAKQVAPRWDLYFGVGGTYFGDTNQDGIEYESVRAHGFFAIEFAFDERHSIFVETNAASRLVTNLAAYPATSWYINAAVKIDFSDRVEFEIGFTENIADQQGTIDFGGFAGLSVTL